MSDATTAGLLTRFDKIEWLNESGSYGGLGSQGMVTSVTQVEGVLAYRVNTGQRTPLVLRASFLDQRRVRVVGRESGR